MYLVVALAVDPLLDLQGPLEVGPLLLYVPGVASGSHPKP